MSVLPMTSQHDDAPMRMTMKDLAQALGGVLEGDDGWIISRITHPDDAEAPGDLVVAMTAALLTEAGQAACPEAKALLTHSELTPAPGRWRSCLKISRPRLALADITKIFAERIYADAGIHATALIDPSARLAANVAVGAYSVIGPEVAIGEGTVIMPGVTIARGCGIGRDCILHSGVRLCERVKIGNRVVIHPNAVIGGDGFSFVTPESGSVESAKSTGIVTGTNTELRRIASLGRVAIGDDVEIGCNTTIDRGTLRATTIGRSTKIDNQVQIGHNVQVGENCMLCGLVGIAGSAIIGNRVVLGGQSGVSDHCRIGDDSVVGGGAGVATNIPPKSIVVGTPAQPRERIAKQYLHLGRLPSLTQRLEQLEAKIKGLEKPGETG